MIRKKEMKSKYLEEEMLDMKKLLTLLQRDGHQNRIVMVIPKESETERLYDEHHDAAVDYRGDDLFEERKVSVKSKSVGLAMRLAGVICLMRTYGLVRYGERMQQ